MFFLKRKKKMYSGLAIADYFINKSLSSNNIITTFDILRLLYLVQVFSDDDVKHRVIKDDFICFKCGPVIRDVYHELLNWEDGIIRRFFNLTVEENMKLEKDKYTTTYLDKIYKIRKLNYIPLKRFIFENGGAWSKTRPYNIIPYELIIEDANREIKAEDDMTDFSNEEIETISDYFDKVSKQEMDVLDAKLALYGF